MNLGYKTLSLKIWTLDVWGTPLALRSCGRFWSSWRVGRRRRHSWLLKKLLGALIGACDLNSSCPTSWVPSLRCRLLGFLKHMGVWRLLAVPFASDIDVKSLCQPSRQRPLPNTRTALGTPQICRNPPQQTMPNSGANQGFGLKEQIFGFLHNLTESLHIPDTVISVATATPFNRKHVDAQKVRRTRDIARRLRLHTQRFSHHQFLYEHQALNPKTQTLICAGIHIYCIYSRSIP